MRYYLVVLFVLFNLIGFSQEPMFKRYTIEDGLPSNEVYRIFEDSKGYLWFSTDRGVSRYDGYEFRNFTAADGLIDNTVFLTSEDSEGRLWFGSYNAQLAYYQNGKIHQFKYNNEIRKLNMSVDPKEELMFFNDTIFVVGDLRTYKVAPNGEVTILDLDFGFHMMPSDDGYFIVHGFKGVNRRNKFPEQRNFKPIKGESFKITARYPTKYRQCSRNGVTYLITGYYIIEAYKDKARVIDSVTSPLDKFFVDSQNRFMLCFIEDGLKICDSTGTGLIERAHLLKGKSVSCVLEDREGGYWISVLGEGIYYAPNLFGTKYYGASLPRDKVTGICHGPDSTFYIGFSTGDVWLLTNESAKRISTDTISLRHGGYNPVYYDFKSGYLYSGKTLLHTINNRFAEIKRQKERYTDRPISTGMLPPAVTCVYPDRDTGVWIGSHSELIHLFNRDSLLYLHPLFDEKLSLNLGRINVDALAQDESGNVWMGTMYGVVRNYNSRWYEVFLEHPLLRSRVDDIVLKNGFRYMASRGNGVIIHSNDTIYNITTEQGLSNNIVNTIAIDSNGIVWAGTNNGLNRITFRENGSFHVKRYTVAHGLPSNHISKLFVGGDRLFVGTIRGLCILEAAGLNITEVAPLMRLNKWEVNGKSMPMIENTDLPYHRNSVFFDFTGISFNNSEFIEYRYMLEGLDKSWETTHNNSVRYYALPSGRYRFLVKACNADGYWSEPVSIAFVISPPFYKEWWFVLCIAFFLVLLLGIVIRRREKLIAARAAMAANFEKETVALKLQSLRLQMNPHFTFNTLNSIQNYISGNDILSANRYLAKFARLIRNILDHSQHVAITLEEEVQSLTEYLELEKLRFKNKLEYKIIVENPTDLNEELIPPTIFQPFVENAVIHGIVPKNGKGLIDIRIRREGDFLECSITDNGVGRSDKKNIFRTSMGLDITRKRLELAGGENRRGGFVIIDLKDTDNKSLGTKVVIRIPIVMK